MSLSYCPRFIVRIGVNDHLFFDEPAKTGEIEEPPQIRDGTERHWKATRWKGQQFGLGIGGQAQ